VQDGHTGLLSPPNDADALAKKILELYSGDTEAVLRANVAKEKLKYSWENLVEKIEELTVRS
jgi:glycosyltransferase involved in cell wall biosynthesis